ncbi:enoyl-CoA hydratase/isomerase family protein [Alicyclobacillus herbarius]|uniref:enoyl-CoA hydratase/isomerase family protein n=1 Tax=Alicyclobacillus herbarius TaxID=122960 RepID=UPI0004252E46|nr:enoyl-CoA hydratase-related protein [Alicyclobacillus herbarius]
MADNLVLLTIRGPVAELKLNRPQQRNALCEEMLLQLEACVDALAGEQHVRVVLVRGEGKAFAAGADIADMQAMSAIEAEAFARLGQRVFGKLEQLPQVTVALVHGYALGGGMELAMACDVRIAVRGAKFGQPEVTLGVIPGFGGSQRLPRIVGQGRALWWLLSGEWIDAEEALAAGLVTQVVEADDLEATAERVATRLAGLPPTALAFIKRAVYEGAEVALPQGLAQEAALFGLCFATEDQKEGMAAFLHKRPAAFRGR